MKREEQLKENKLSLVVEIRMRGQTKIPGTMVGCVKLVAEGANKKRDTINNQTDEHYSNKSLSLSFLREPFESDTDTKRPGQVEPNAFDDEEEVGLDETLSSLIKTVEHKTCSTQLGLVHKLESAKVQPTHNLMAGKRYTLKRVTAKSIFLKVVKKQQADLNKIESCREYKLKAVSNDKIQIKVMRASKNSATKHVSTIEHINKSALNTIYQKDRNKTDTVSNRCKIGIEFTLKEIIGTTMYVKISKTTEVSAVLAGANTIQIRKK